MSDRQALAAVAPPGRRRRTLGLVAVLGGVLVVMLWRAPEPIINLTNRTYFIAVLLGFCVSVALASALEYARFFNLWNLAPPVYDRDSIPFTAQAAAGLAFAASAVVAGQLMGRTGRYKRPILALVVIGMIGTLLLSRLNSQTGAVELALGLAITGWVLAGCPRC